ncbi:MAG: oxidoreductase [Actinomycetes bacterium]
MLRLLIMLRRLRQQRGLGRPSAGSVAVRLVDAGSCNGCEHELNALGGPYYDVARLGVNVVASPRHADLLLVTGSITSAMVDPLRHAYESMPEPRRVVALGNCALGVDLLGSPEVCGSGVGAVLPVDITIAGCPRTPEVIAVALADLTGHGPSSAADDHLGGTQQ